MSNDLHNLFPAALNDTLTPSQRAEFEAAIAADPVLVAEFEAFVDSQQGDIANVHAWLVASGKGPLPDTYNRMAHEVLRRATEHKRGRLITLFGGLAAAAAAAAIVAIIWIQPGTTTDSGTTQPWPQNTAGEVTVLAGGHRYFEAEFKDFHPATGVTLQIAKDALVQPDDKGARITSGLIRATTEDGASYSVLVGDQRIELAQAASIEVRVEAEQFEETQLLEHKMFNSRMLARFGAKSLTFTLTVLAGSVTLYAAEGPRVLNAPQALQAQANPPHGQPPKVEDVFTHLDADADGKLDDTEVPQHMIDDFDDDASGDIDLDEFKLHHKPPMHGPRPEEEFKRLDRNADGKLEIVEVEQKLIDDFDDNSDGEIDLDEFRAHFKPPAEPKAEDHFAHLDINGDGKLDDTELPDKMLEDLDSNGDDEVDLDEFKANHKPPQPPKPQKPEDVFAKLDANADGAIDNTETEQKMIDDFDDDAGGDIDLDEFRDHWRPMPPRPEDAFNDLDGNDDGSLDDNEIPKAIVTDWDDDQSGMVDLDEFKAHHKPPMPGPGQGPGGPGPGGPGIGPGPGGPGGGPGKPPQPR